MSLFVATPNQYTGRRGPLTYVVWHATISAEVTGGAYNVAAGWFAKAAAQASAHIVADDGSDPRYPDGIVECVKPGDTAWHALAANSRGYGVELVGRADQDTVQWHDPYSLASIRNAAAWIRQHPALQHIPARWLTDAELARGDVPGHTTHAQVSRVLGGDHTDPGELFPGDYLMACLAGQGEDDMPTSYPSRIPGDNYGKPVPTDVGLAYIDLHTSQTADALTKPIPSRVKAGDKLTLPEYVTWIDKNTTDARALAQQAVDLGKANAAKLDTLIAKLGGTA